MSERSIFCKKEVLCADGERARISYFRVKKREHYGILVELQKGRKTEQGRAECLTDCPEKLNDLLSILAKNSVTPCTLEEILRDMATNFEKR